MQAQIPKTIKILALGFGMLWFGGTVHELVAQEPAADTTAFLISKPAAISVFAGTGYGSDLMYTVSSLSDHRAFMSADVMISWKRTLWASATFYYLPGLKITLPLYDLSIGYRHVFNKYFDVGLSLSSYQSASGLDEQYYESFQFMRISGGFDWQWIYTRATLGSIVGEQSGLYYYFRNSRFFTTPDLGATGGYFTFDPNINLLFGNSTQIVPVQRPNKPGQGRPHLPHQGTTTTEDIFGLLQMEFSIPIAFQYHLLTLEAEPLYMISMNKTPDDTSNAGFHFFINLVLKVF